MSGQILNKQRSGSGNYGSIVIINSDDEENLTTSNISNNKPSNEYVLNVAFFSFVGFLSVQAVFALIANSQSMLADSESMSVDALTYLFNLIAERMKKLPLSEKEQLMSLEICHYKRELRRLYLELIPPAISVVTLICITIWTTKEALETLRGIQDDDDNNGEDVSVVIMFIFSGVNLLLDFVNVTCFARANSLFGLDMFYLENSAIKSTLHIHKISAMSIVHKRSDETSLLSNDETDGKNNTNNLMCDCPHDKNDNILDPDEGNNNAAIFSNLNMCSAWTVSQTMNLCVQINRWY